MGSLSVHLNRLTACLARACPELRWQDIALVEAACTVVAGSRLRVPRAALVSPAEFSPRFEEYLHGGYSWINLSAAGVVNGLLVVVVEVPTRASGAPARTTAVNLSGPAPGIQLEMASEDPV